MDHDADLLRPFNRPAAIATIIAIFAIAPAVYLMLPAFVGALAETYGFSESQLGLLASADLTGMAIAAVTALYWRTRWNWRWVVGTALAWVVVGNLLSTGLSQFGPLVALRLLVGFGGGMAVAPCLAFLTYTRDPDRVAAALAFFQIVFMVVSFAVAPAVVGAWGVNGVFLCLAGLTALLIPMVRMVPAGPPGEGQRVGTRPSFRRYVPGLVVLVSLGLFQLAQAGVWAFVKLMGEAGGLSGARVAAALSVTALISLSGPLAAGIVGDRFGRFLPLALSVAMQAAVLTAFGLGGLGFPAFVACIAVFQVFWGLSVPYQYGVMVQVDDTKRLMVLAPTFQATGVALGPALVGFGIHAVGYVAVSLIAGVALLLHAALILPGARTKGSV